MTRDQFLTEKMGECRHKWNYNECTKCGIDVHSCRVTTQDFSTWEGFGKLWEWSLQQKWWNEFIINSNHTGLSYNDVSDELINPNRFADAVAKYLGFDFRHVPSCYTGRGGVVA